MIDIKYLIAVEQDQQLEQGEHWRKDSSVFDRVHQNQELPQCIFNWRLAKYKLLSTFRWFKSYLDKKDLNQESLHN